MHEYGFKLTNALECGSLCEIEANVNLLVQLKERLRRVGGQAVVENP